MTPRSLNVRPIGPVAKLLNTLLRPLMYFVAWSWERPQESHPWNTWHLKPRHVQHLSPALMAQCEGNPRALRWRWFGPFPVFHMPIIGGWRDYGVFQTTQHTAPWFVGWISEDSVGISRIPLETGVRMLLGPKEARFFAINANGDQIPLTQIATGRIGTPSAYSELPIL